MRDLMRYFLDLTGCEAVGVRLRQGDDFPYYETRGFPEEFVLAENRLCAIDEKGEIVRDGAGHPLYDCMCGNILCGRFDPSKPFFTARGSFWSSCTTELLASTTDADRQAKTRNRCNGEGYESVALVPIRSQGETFGLFQFNDRRKGRFTAERIALLEDLVDHVAIALAKLRADEALRLSEKRYRSLFENMLEGYAYCRMLGEDGGPRDFVYLDVNDAFVKLTGLKDVVGKKVTEVIPGIRESNPELFEIYGRVSSTGKAEKAEIYVDPLKTWFSLSAFSPARGFFVAVFDNITERKKLEEQLRQSQKMEAVGQLAGGIAHDFNNLLTVINGYAELLAGPHRREIAAAQERGRDPAGRGPGRVAHPAAARLQPAAGPAAEGPRPERGDRRPGQDAPPADRGGHRARTILRPDLGTVLADPGQIEQVLLNLAVNARDAMPAGGTADPSRPATSCSTRPSRRSIPAVVPGPHVLLAVSDTGTGMAEGDPGAHLRAVLHHQGERQGDGLGLSTVYGIVKQSDGHISVYSEPGKGTTFKIYLPRVGEGGSGPVLRFPRGVVAGRRNGAPGGGRELRAGGHREECFPGTAIACSWHATGAKPSVSPGSTKGGSTCSSRTW